jgi:6-phosphogluconolactonase (cycloisomerase 2 family)
MRMKFNKSSQLLLVSAASLLVAGLMTACSTATLDFVYVSSSLAAGSNSYGEIDVFEINAYSGYMRPIPASPFPSGGRDPVAMAVSSDNGTLYVVNQLDNNIVQFLIGPDGKLYPLNTVNTPGIYPLAVAVNGSNLFVVDTFQPQSGCSLAAPCSGSVAVFPIEAASGTGSTATPAGTLGTPVTNTSNSATYWPLVNTNFPTHVMVPTAINVLHGGAYVYITAYDSSAVAANNEGSVNICNLNASAYSGAVGYVFGFSVGSTGALTKVPGSPFAAGSLPCGVASDSSGSHVYVTDYIKGQVLGYSVASGVLTSLPSVQYNSYPYPAGNQPKAIAVDPSYPYLYVANSLDGTVSAYEISDGTLSCNQSVTYPLPTVTPTNPAPPYATIPAGALCNLGSVQNATGAGTYSAGQQPVAVGIDPSASHFVFTANFLGSNVSDFEMSTTAGTLINAQHSPYTSNAQPTAVVAIPNSGGPKQ